MMVAQGWCPWVRAEDDLVCEFIARGADLDEISRALCARGGADRTVSAVRQRIWLLRQIDVLPGGKCGWPDGVVAAIRDAADGRYGPSWPAVTDAINGQFCVDYDEKVIRAKGEWMGVRLQQSAPGAVSSRPAGFAQRADRERQARLGSRIVDYWAQRGHRVVVSLGPAPLFEIQSDLVFGLPKSALADIRAANQARRGRTSPQLTRGAGQSGSAGPFSRAGDK